MQVKQKDSSFSGRVHAFLSVCHKDREADWGMSVLLCSKVSQNNSLKSTLQILFELAGFVPLLCTQDVQAGHLPEQQKFYIRFCNYLLC